MKIQLSVCLSVCLSLGTLWSQAPAVKFMPEYSQGFMVFNHDAYPTVSLWDLKIYENTYTGGVKNSTQIESFRLGGINYLHIPVEYYQPEEGDTIDYSFSIVGYNSSEQEEVNEGPQNLCQGCLPPFFEELNSWKCNGKRAAWEIKIWRNTNWNDPVSGGHFFLKFDQALGYTTTDNGGNGVPYYEWATKPWYDAMCEYEQSQSHITLREFYGLSFYNCTTVNESPQIITRLANSLDGLRNAQCGSITGPIYGIQKYLGDWRSSAGMLVDIGTSDISGYDPNGIPYYSYANYMSDPTQPGSELIQYVNNNNIFNLDVPLECDKCINVPGWPPGNPGEGWWIGQTLKPLLPPWWGDGEFPDFSGNNLFASIDYVSEVIGGEPLVINHDYVWYSGLWGVHISRVDDSGISIILERDKMFDSLGNFVPISVIFEPGLYRFEFIDDNLNGLAFMYECEQEEDNTLYEKDFLNVLVYPVPLTGNSFSMNLEALAKVEFDYTLYGPGLNILHTQHYRLDKDYEGTEYIESGVGTSGWPSGNYVHHFLFSDGSVKSFVTPKL